jgi:hypothetical protein
MPIRFVGVDALEPELVNSFACTKPEPMHQLEEHDQTAHQFGFKCISSFHILFPSRGNRARRTANDVWLDNEAI